MANLGRRTNYGMALLAALVWLGVNLVVLLLLLGPPSADGLASYTGRGTAIVLLAALPVWLIARRREGGWPFWQLVLLALPFYLLMYVIAYAPR